MKVVRNDENNNSLTVAEMEALKQFEQSPRAGQVVFHPRVTAGRSTPDIIAFFEEVGRLSIAILEGRYTVEGNQWYRHEADGTITPVDKLLEGAWQAATEVREELNRELGLTTYVIAVAWFPDMDEDILDAAGAGSVRWICGRSDLAERLLKLPKDHELRPEFNGQYIEQEVAVLSRSSAAVDPEPAEESSPSVKGRVGALILERVETVNIYITIVNGDTGDDPPLITVRGQ